MTDTLQLAQSRLLTPGGLGLDGLDAAFGRLMGPGVDYGDLYFQHSRREGWSLEDGIVKDGSHSIEQGVGVRAVSGEKTGFAYSDDIRADALLESASAARAISRSGGQAAGGQRVLVRGRELYAPVDPIDGMATDEKVNALREVDQWLRAQDPRVKQVVVSLSGGVDTVLVARSDGTLASDVRPLVRFNVQVIVEHEGRREQGYSGAGGRYSYAELFSGGRPRAVAKEALRQALVNLEAVDAPAGTLPVVLGPGWPGILLHEAIGHGLEGDFNRKKTSAFSGLIGQRIAAPGVTVVDDGTIGDRRGSLTIDDEGTPTSRTVLIEDGILKGYMHDRMNARLMGHKATGNGRRQAFDHQPMPRMTNTVMESGTEDPAGIIASVKKGLYAVNFGGGQVDITNGKFVFAASEAYLIENGKVTRPVKGATLIGNGPDVLTKVRAIGNDMAMDPGIGTCGKAGQGVPVGVGQPTLRIDGLTVGGTQT